jgi:putative oxidoreductase
MTTSSFSVTAKAADFYQSMIVDRLERVPYFLLALPLRAAVAVVFWNSGVTKLDDWSATLSLFADDFMLPAFLPTVFMAKLTTAIELSTAVLLVLGLATRPAALLLLGMTAFIEIFVFPAAWPVHIQWAAMLLVLLCRGPGKISLDALAAKLRP